MATLRRFATPTPIVALPRSPTAADQAFAEIAGLL
jgi:hypothetical protein